MTAPHMLSAGHHYGHLLQQSSFAGFTLSRIQYPSAAKHSLHGNAETLLVFIERGSYRKKVGRTELMCTKDELVFIPARQLQTDEFGAKETICLIADFDSSFLNRIRELGAVIPNAALFSGADFAGQGARMLQEFRHIDSVSTMIFEGILLNILASGFRVHRSSFGPKIPSWLLEAKDLLHDRFCEALTMESVAQEVGVHPVHFSHEFRRFFNSNPGEYLRRIRVNFAAKQLTATSTPLSEIAIAAGFSDQAHFCRTFRRFTQLTPLEFRRMTRKRP